MLETDYLQKTNSILQNRFSDFDPIEDIEVLADQEKRCMVRTEKLIPTLLFMQRAGWKIWELVPDDEYVSGIRLEYNILTYYKTTTWQKQN